MTPNPWLPLVSVALGGFLTLLSSLFLEQFRVRAADRREFLRRRASAFEELERAAIDAHAKLLQSANMVSILQPARSSSADEGAVLDSASAVPNTEVASERTGNEKLVKVLVENSGKVELLRAVGLAARIGTPEIRRGIADYAAVQFEWTRVPANPGPMLEDLELRMRRILELVAGELRTLDEVTARE